MRGEEVLLLGLDPSLTSQLARALGAQGRRFHCEPRLPPRPRASCLFQRDIGVVFCPAQRHQCLPVLELVRRHRPQLPVVVVSRIPETAQWLDAVDAGAADYCCPPFDAEQFGWILTSVFRYRRFAAA